MAEHEVSRSELPFFVAELGERLAHDRSAVSAHEFSRIPTIPAGIRTPPHPIWNLLTVSRASGSISSLC
jgi:hypothetical protein